MEQLTPPPAEVFSLMEVSESHDLLIQARLVNKKKRGAQLVFMDCITNNMEDMAIMILKNPFMQFFLIDELQAALKLNRSKLPTIDQL